MMGRRVGVGSRLRSRRSTQMRLGRCDGCITGVGSVMGRRGAVEAFVAGFLPTSTIGVWLFIIPALMIGRT